MRLRLSSAREGFHNLMESADPRIRNRLLATSILLLLIVFLVTFNVEQGLPDTGSVNSRLILFVAINVNIVLLAVVFYLIAKNLLKLVVERRQQVLGVTLKTKLIAAFTLLSLPAMAFHLFASSFISATLESWLTGQHETVVENAREVSEVYHRDLKKMLELQGWIVAETLRTQPELYQQLEQLDAQLQKQLGDGLTFYSGARAVRFQKLRTEDAREHWKPLSAAEWYQLGQNDSTWLVEELNDRFLYRHLQRLNAPNEEEVLLELFHPTPVHITQALNGILEQERNTRFFNESEDLLRRYYIVIFLLMTLCIVFVATWLAFYFARGFVQPIENLAQATQRVAEGELGYQVETNATLDKDFALLVRAFNAMSQDLEINQVALEKTTEHLQQSHQALEEQHRLLELVLENISTGVVLLDPDGNLRRVNRAAMQLLEWRNLEETRKPFHEALEESVLTSFSEMWEQLGQPGAQSVYRHVTLLQNDVPVQVAVTMLMLKSREDEPLGVIAVYNNITEIHRLQRAQAWREVARRIAHEIKNPLTPIQLSAERIRRRYANKVEDPQALHQATQTIISEVEQLKLMVSEFSQFARIPESNPRPTNLHDVLHDVVCLYQENLPTRIHLVTELCEDMPLLSIDPEQMKRVFINLVDNAIDAVEKKGRLSRLLRQGEVKLATSVDETVRIARIEVTDNGTGIEPEIADRLFEPYATTKKDGTGLGLTIIHQTISDHDGFVRFRNVEGGGACFTIELPLG
jgi:two-component system nitrogen regulation sensor histidine kinase NtrY